MTHFTIHLVFFTTALLRVQQSNKSSLHDDTLYGLSPQQQRILCVPTKVKRRCIIDRCQHSSAIPLLSTGRQTVSRLSSLTTITCTLYIFYFKLKQSSFIQSNSRDTACIPTITFCSRGNKHPVQSAKPTISIKNCQHNTCSPNCTHAKFHDLLRRLG